MNIRIKKVGKQIYFKLDEIVNNKDLNVTNIWDFKEIIFEEEKLKETFIIEFLKDLFIKEQIEKVNIEKNNLFLLVKNIIKNVPNIHSIKFEEQTTLPSNLFEELKDLKYIKEINCYQATSFLLEELEKNNVNVIFRKKEFIKSDFMITNDLNTIPKIKFKKKILLYDNMKNKDMVDLDYFLRENKSLTKVECYSYNQEFIKDILVKLLVNQKKNITVVIFQEKEEIKINELIHSLDKNLKKELKLMNIKVIPFYTKDYKEKFYLKQLNITMFRILLIILLIITTAIYIMTKFELYHNQIEKKQYEEITTEKAIEEESTEVEETKEEQKTTSTEKTKEKTYEKNFQNLKKINSEFVTWLTVKNTNISYPVVQHNDNTYYLSHSFDKSNNIYGWVFMDYRNNKNLTDQNTIIYAHDTYDSILFGTLKNVLNKSWYENQSNLTITLETENKKIEAEIFSIYTIPNTTDYLQIVFSDNEFESFINTITNRSIANFNNTPTVTDKIITLSTCYKDSKSRLVVHAKIK